MFEEVNLTGIILYIYTERESLHNGSERVIIMKYKTQVVSVLSEPASFDKLATTKLMRQMFRSLQ